MADPEHFDADPDPTFQADADPDPNPQGWEFAHRISERIARFFAQK